MKAVFLDRDDTLIPNRSVTADSPTPGDLFDPDLVRLLPGVAGALRDLKDAGFLLIVVTNQGCVASGHCTVDDVEATNARLHEIVYAATGVELDAVYYAPYRPSGHVEPWNIDHPWRKPAPGMLLAAERDFDLDLTTCWIVGDGERDIEAGLRAGIPARQCLMIGEGREFESVADATDRILGRTRLVEVTEASLAARITLDDTKLRDMIVANAEALAERTGLRLHRVDVEGSTLTVALEAPEIVGVAFVAELRRATNRWHRARTGEPIWKGA